MIRRVMALAEYFGRSLLFSLAGLLYILFALVCWWVLFDPRQTTPHVDYYILVNGVLGVTFAFLVTLTIAAHANRAVHYPWLARLPSRTEYLAAALISGFVCATALQILVALLATFHGPAFTLGRVAQLPMVWLPINLLGVLMALHTSDLVSNGWSRVCLYGGLLIFYLGQRVNETTTAGLAARLDGLGHAFNLLSRWLASAEASSIAQIFGIPFWPFGALTNAVRADTFQPSLILAPMVLVLYGVILWRLAAKLFVGKDLQLTEQ
jgi:hypothetical protein